MAVSFRGVSLHGNPRSAYIVYPTCYIDIRIVHLVMWCLHIRFRKIERYHRPFQCTTIHQNQPRAPDFLPSPRTPPQVYTPPPRSLTTHRHLCHTMITRVLDLSLKHCNHAGTSIQEGSRAGVISATVWLLVNGDPQSFTLFGE